MDNKKHLPFLGIGPLYVGLIILVTFISILFSHIGIITTGSYKNTKILFLIVGLILIILGIYMWIQSVIISKIDKNISENKLVTTGIYSHTRNPIYTAFIFICTGVIFINNNLWLLILPLIYYIFLTILMINTEEKWLKRLYGKEYVEYCKKVNRCIPIKNRRVNSKGKCLKF